LRPLPRELTPRSSFIDDDPNIIGHYLAGTKAPLGNEAHAVAALHVAGRIYVKDDVPGAIVAGYESIASSGVKHSDSSNKFLLGHWHAGITGTKGARNNYKHGRYTAEAIASRRWVSESATSRRATGPLSRPAAPPPQLRQSR
jgi:hypothetical protein